jgi:hypothetical protein
MSDVSVARGKDGRRKGMMQRNSRSQGTFHSLKGSAKLWSPWQCSCSFAGICERLEGSGNDRKETAVKIQHAKETLEGFDITRG